VPLFPVFPHFFFFASVFASGGEKYSQRTMGLLLRNLRKPLSGGPQVVFELRRSLSFHHKTSSFFTVFVAPFELFFLSYLE